MENNREPSELLKTIFDAAQKGYNVSFKGGLASDQIIIRCEYCLSGKNQNVLIHMDEDLGTGQGIESHINRVIKGSVAKLESIQPV